jgi:GH15 family glucan-1,4-alpha-glucosidase
MRIEDYALIGDLQTSALVARNGSVDWLCLPRFDSASCFTALLGEEKHGRWLIAPAGEVRSVSRRYRQGTLILETDFETAEGAARVIDFMPLRDGGAGRTSPPWRSSPLARGRASGSPSAGSPPTSAPLEPRIPSRR